MWALTQCEGKKVRRMKDLLVIFVIFFLCFDLYRLFRAYWILKKKKEAKLSFKPRVMKPKNEKDCPFCVKENGELGSLKPEMPTAWGLMGTRG